MKNMGSKAASKEEEASLNITIPLLSIRSTKESPNRAWMATSPMHTTASVPFHWEEEPGKPKILCKSMSKPDNKHVLQLPPRLLFGAKNSELISPKSVLDESDHVLGRLKIKSASFRMARDFNIGGNNRTSPTGRKLGNLVLSKRWDKDKERGFLDSLRIEKLKFKERNEGAREINKGSCYKPSIVYRENGIRGNHGEIKEKVNVKLARVRRNGSVPLPKPKSHFLTSIYESLKQLLPWKRKKSKKIYGNADPYESPISDTRMFI